ncbi:MAG: tRNA uridine-5-carboxymethylaminomethyl(34) synthesis GTPase MnmE [Firmicutes bacterium]|jgi:tRNA modification GTPase|nr:tRNA uridine-5-carboxymethylaminomethyl(34) synthesis GTPase MnmE [Bacillota bacterium]MDH7495858.1 tRNA uridine-5-carboxymethylaminomethyl(34) synthesis GTPase MnmE [Bacillota bacterium]
MDERRFVENETIAAISTPIGEGGIGVVRISGPDAMNIAARLFRDPSGSRHRALRPWRLRYGVVVDPETGEVIDEALASAMPAPHSFTREDVVEFSCHGGVGPLSRVLEAVIRCGARLAQPGEFTRRAFLSGRIDLAQAEAVIELVRAKTDSARRLAVANLRGGFSEAVVSIRDDIVALLAELEAAVDFPEDEVGEPDRAGTIVRAREAASSLRGLAERGRRGRVYRDGVTVAIVGRPNVGKSSLLNAMLGRSRAIVTEIPGTTRDAVEDWTTVRGIPVRLVDTAGLRETDDPVERLGVEGTLERIEEADLTLAVIDGSEPLSGGDIEVLRRACGEAGGKGGAVVLNKSDLPPRVSEGDVAPYAAGMPVIRVSAKDGSGVDRLEETIAGLAAGRTCGASEGMVMATARQQEALERAAVALGEVERGLAAGAPLDLAAIDMREALFWLDQITGRSASDDVLDRIFSEFCIGK